MVLAQYLSTTVYRYYIKKLLTKIPAIFTKRAAIQLKVNFYNPRGGTIVQFKNPRAGIKDNFYNPRGGTKVAFSPRSKVA